MIQLDADGDLMFNYTITAEPESLRLSYPVFKEKYEFENDELEIVPNVQNMRENGELTFAYEGDFPEHFGTYTSFATSGEFWLDANNIAEGFTADVTVTETVDGEEPISAEYTLKLPELTKRELSSLTLHKAEDAGRLVYYEDKNQVYEKNKGPVDWSEYFELSPSLGQYDPRPEIQLWYKYKEERNAKWTRLYGEDKPLRPGRYSVYVSNSPEDPNYKYRESEAIEIMIQGCTAQNFTKRYDGNPVTPEDCKATANVEGQWLWSDETGTYVMDPPMNISDSGMHYLTFVPDDETYETFICPVIITITESGGGSSSSSNQDVTVPVFGDEKRGRVDVNVKGSKAVVKDVNMSDLDNMVYDEHNADTFTIDFSDLEEISEVELPPEILKLIEEAMKDPDNSTVSFEIVLFDDVSIVFDVEILEEQTNGEEIGVSVKSFEDTKPNIKQTEVIQGRPVYDISLTSGGKNLSEMGGVITIDVPYELQEGEQPEGIVVWYVDENGNKERCETSYDTEKKRVSWQTDHLSLYMIGYEVPTEEKVPAAENMENPFTDVSKDMYYFNAVLWALREGITSGITETSFAPDATCTRGQMAAFLWRAMGKPEPTGKENPFEDVAADAYYAKAVQWAYEQGITGGTSATTFSPNATCTRAQMAVFIYHLEQAKGGGFTGMWMFRLPFTDTPDWAYEAIAWCYKEGVVSGTSETTFSPDANCTRGQMVTFLYRYFTK